MAVPKGKFRHCDFEFASKPRSLKLFSLHFRPVDDFSSAMFEACSAGDIDTMKQLFRTELASAYDINNEGEDLKMAGFQSQLSQTTRTHKLYYFNCTPIDRENVRNAKEDGTACSFYKPGLVKKHACMLHKR